MKINKEELYTFVEKLAAIDASELTVENDGLKICIKHDKEVVYTTAQTSVESAPVVSKESSENVPAEAEVDVPENKVQPGNPVTAPIDGTYYSSPGPEDPPYVKVGDVLKKGEPICILEAMKMMNTVDMPEDGTIISIEVNNEDIVAAGQVLVRYER